MADEENYSEEEFGFSEDFEEEGFDEDVESESEEFTAEEDVFDNDATKERAESSSKNNLIRYGLFVVGLVAIGYGGYQTYELFSPSRPQSAFDKKQGSSMVSSLTMETPEKKAESIPMMPTMPEPAKMAEPEKMVEPAKMAEPEKMPEPAKMAEPEKMVEPSKPAEPAMAEPSKPEPTVTAEPAPQKEVVVRYEMPKELINRQNSIESSMRNLQERMVSIEDSSRTVSDNSATVRKDLQELSRVLKQLDSRISKLDKQIDSMSDNMQTNKLMVQKKLQSMKKEMTVSPSRKINAKSAVVQTARYYIQAMIPGRAWIKSKKGATITVRRGSIVRGYGRVLSIDVENGRIVTTSGNVIRFHPSER